MAVEGKTSGKNTSTDQRQIQLTTGTTGASSPNVTATEGSSQNFGTNIQGQGPLTVNSTDMGAIGAAFEFGDNIAKALGDALASSNDASAQAQKSNTDFLGSVLGSLSNQTDSGQAANNNKTLLYLGIGALVLGALFVWRR